MYSSIYPRVDPSIISLVLAPCQDACLLARQRRFPPNMFSCLAGFMEPGWLSVFAPVDTPHHPGGAQWWRTKQHLFAGTSRCPTQPQTLSRFLYGTGWDFRSEFDQRGVAPTSVSASHASPPKGVSVLDIVNCCACFETNRCELRRYHALRSGGVQHCKTMVVLQGRALR